VVPARDGRDEPRLGCGQWRLIRRRRRRLRRGWLVGAFLVARVGLGLLPSSPPAADVPSSPSAAGVPSSPSDPKASCKPTPPSASSIAISPVAARLRCGPLAGGSELPGSDDAAAPPGEATSIALSPVGFGDAPRACCSRACERASRRAAAAAFSLSRSEASTCLAIASRSAPSRSLRFGGCFGGGAGPAERVCAVAEEPESLPHARGCA
jgi:hypothetical protein